MSEPDETDRRWFLTLDGAVLEAIGSLTVQFAHLEAQLSMFIASLLAGFDAVGAAPNAERAREQARAQRLGQAVTLKLGFRQKLEILVSLSSQRLSESSDLLRQVQDIAKELEAAAAERNRTVHSMWGTFSLPDGSQVPGVGVRIKPARDKKLGMAQSVSLHTQDQIAAVADSIAKLGYRLDELRAHCFPTGESAGP